MTQTDTQTESKGGLLRIWELELVISGAVIVGLFQIPSAIDGIYNQISLHVSNDVHLFPFLFYYFSKLLLYPLLMTFMLHFFLRGLWVGLIGLSYVYPNGIKWDRLDLPPLEEQVHRGANNSLESFQEKIDKFSSSLFSILFVFLIIFLWCSLLAMVCMPLSLLLKNTFFHGTSLNTLLMSVFYGVLFIFFGCSVMGSIFDKRLKKKPEVLGKYPKLEAMVRFSYRMIFVGTLGFLYVPIIMTFRSNLKKGKAITGYFLLVFLFPCIFVISFLLSKGVILFESYQYFPQKANVNDVYPLHYDNLRDPETISLLPSIQSDMVQDKYVKLFLPFKAKWDNTLMVESCPDLEPYRPDGFTFAFSGSEESRNQEVLTCLTGLYKIALNGDPLDELSFSFYSHPESKIKGIVAYIPTTLGVDGRNLLKIEKKRRKKSLEKEEKDDELKKKNAHKGIWYVPFWL